jgi:hypothetical protein
MEGKKSLGIKEVSRSGEECRGNSSLNVVERRELFPQSKKNDEKMLFTLLAMTRSSTADRTITTLELCLG